MTFTLVKNPLSMKSGAFDKSLLISSLIGRAILKRVAFKIAGAILQLSDLGLFKICKNSAWKERNNTL